jgi:hypothetical protein
MKIKKTKTDFIRMSSKRQNFENMSDFLIFLRRKGTDTQRLADVIIKSGGRSLFDPYCSEWHDTSYQEKLNFLIDLSRQGLRLNTLINVYEKMHRERGRNDIADVVKDALAELLEYHSRIDAKSARKKKINIFRSGKL